MKVSMWMIYDYISQHCTRSCFDSSASVRSVRGVLPAKPSGCNRADYLYIADASGESVSCDAKNLLFVGDNFSIDTKNTGCWIAIDRRAGVSGAFELVSRALEYYSDWYDELQGELNGNQDLNTICEIGSALLDNSVFLYDEAYTMIAGKLNTAPCNSTEFLAPIGGTYYSISSDTLRILKNNRDFQKTFRTSGVSECFVPYIGFPVLYENLNGGAEYKGRVCVLADTRAIKQSDYQLIELLTEACRIAIKRRKNRSDDLSRVFRTFIHQLLDGVAFDEKQLADSLGIWNWHKKGRYICVAAFQEEEYSRLNTDLYAASQAELAVPGSCAVQFQDMTVCIISLSDRSYADEAVARLEKVFDGFSAATGVSEVFSDITECSEYYLEARIAAQFGAISQERTHAHYFRDCAHTHYFRYGTSVLPASHFCDADVKLLMKYRGTRTDYYDTLKTYLEHNMNLLDASNALNIHRTTLFNRLGKMRELISADLNSADDRIRLIISFKLMEVAEHNGNS